MSPDVADLTVVTEIVDLPITPRLKLDDFDEVTLGEDSGRDLELPLAISLVEVDSRCRISRKKRVELSVGSLEGVDVTSMTAVSNHFVESFVFLSQADYATTNDNVVRSTTWASLLRGDLNRQTRRR